MYKLKSDIGLSMYNQGTLRREEAQKIAYIAYLDSVKYYSEYWVKLHVALDAQIFEDETVNSIVPLSNHGKRAGKYTQHTFIVCYSFKLNYGYYLNTLEHFKFLKPKQIEQFYDLVAKRDQNFNTVWFKDSRRYGKTDKIKGMLSTSKANTSKIERLFSRKIKIYHRLDTIKSQTDLNNAYSALFSELNIKEIHP
jgi:hypothetical protein